MTPGRTSYVLTWLGLALLSVTTAGLSFLSLGAFGPVAALAIACVKVTLIGLFFMHLVEQPSANALLLGLALLLVALLLGLAATDVATRREGRFLAGEALPAAAARPSP